VVGSETSSNSLRMVEVARDQGVARAELVDRADHIEPSWL
jgi:4-hydroxy-3-methylbut-2-enyl diphosphate reductase